MVTPFNKPAPLEEGKMSPKRILEDFSLNVVIRIFLLLPHTHQVKIA